MGFSAIINQLEEVTAETELRTINDIFNTLIAEIQSYLDLFPIRKEVELEISKSSEPKTKEQSEGKFFSAGVKRDLDSNSITLFKDYSKYFPPIILREAYNCFLPNNLLAGKYVQMIINQLVVNNLPKFKFIDEWNLGITQKVVDMEFIAAHFNTFKKFLDNRTRVQMTFQFLREKEPVIDNMGDLLYKNIYYAYMWKSARTMNNNELLETVRVLFNLFKEYKSYKSLEEYMGYFQQYAVAGMTEQSQRKFKENMGWIKDHSSISPSHLVNWMHINVVSIDFYFKFNPLLKKDLIIRVMENFPFFVLSRRLRNSAATEISGIFLVPVLYLKDFISLLQKMHARGYLLEEHCHRIYSGQSFLNLNYFREFHSIQKKFISRNHPKYHDSFELNTTYSFHPSNTDLKLSVLDFLILERVRNLSFTGFTFERRMETLNLFRSDLEGLIISEENLVGDIENVFEKLNTNQKYQSELLQFIHTFHNTKISQKAGFFYIRYLLEDLLKCLKSINMTILKNPMISNIYHLRDYIRMKGLSNDLQTNILFNDKQINQLMFNEFIPLYFQSKEEFLTVVEKFHFFNDFFTICNRIKVFDLDLIRQIIERKEVRTKIHTVRKDKLINYYEIFNPKSLKSEHIEAKVDEFIQQDPPVLEPLLINTIATTAFCNYFPVLILRDSPETRKHLEKVIKFTPRSFVIYCRDLLTKEKRISLFIYLPNIKEKDFFLSIMQSIFSTELISFGRSYTSGLVPGRALYTFVDFFDFDTNSFFYNKELYDQFFFYIKRSFGDVPEIATEIPHSIQQRLWYTKKTLKDLSKEVEDRFSKDNIDHDKIALDTLLEFHTNLGSNLKNSNLFFKASQSPFFNRYVKSIKFVPAFQRFGFSQYILFIHPFSIEDPKWKLDWNLLLSNTFQNVKYPVRIDTSTSLFIKYLFPYRNPNMTYINWLAKSKRVIREYFFFFVKSVSQLFHFNSNLNEENKWIYDADRFEIHIQNILFNPDYRRQLSDIKQYNLGNLKNSKIFSPNSDEFQNLTEIYSWKADDLKQYYDKNSKPQINLISELMNKELIFPFLTVKSLNLLEKVYIILPNVKKDVYQKIVQIFDFFNFGFIYEIEGEYFIYGMDQEIQFENGIMIKLYFPDCKMFQFQDIFEQIFQYLKIEHYLILNDLTDGKRFLEYIYDDLGFLEKYNPLNNLIWNDKDKRWMNHKLFNEKFEPIYPSLLPEEED